MGPEDRGTCMKRKPEGSTDPPLNRSMPVRKKKGTSNEKDETGAGLEKVSLEWHTWEPL